LHHQRSGEVLGQIREACVEHERDMLLCRRALTQARHIILPQRRRLPIIAPARPTTWSTAPLPIIQEEPKDGRRR
jgi:hypothetical protein